MSWAARRRFFILLIVGAISVSFAAIVLIATFKQTPSCTDNTQNQGEAGIDCGGPCAYLCTAELQPPTVLFTKTLTSGGRTVVVASVENKNVTAAAKNVPYRVSLYDNHQVLIQQVTGVLDLPPGATETIFIPNIVSGKQIVTNAFLDIASSSPKWFTLTTDPRIIPIVSNMTRGGSESAPRIQVILSNASAATLTNVQTIVLVRNEKGSIIAASATIIPSIPAQGQATATFTWNNAFPGAPAAIEVVPVIPLP